MINSNPTKSESIATIAISPRIFVQGTLVQRIAKDLVQIRVGDMEFRGRPINETSRL